MAENKRSFILYVDTIQEILKELPREVKGDLFQLIVDYVNDLDPKPDDVLLKTAFASIKLQLKRDLVKWEQIRQKRSVAGKASANKKQHMLTHVESVEQTSTNSTVNDNVNVNVNVNEININPINKVFSIEECLKIALNDPRWVKANKVTRLDLEQFNKVLEKRGVYEKNAFDYKTHFANFKTTGKIEIGPTAESINDKLKQSIKKHATN